MDIVFNLLLVRSRAYTVTGHPDLAANEMQTVRSEAEALGYVNQLAYALSGLAALSTQAGRLDDATNYAKQAVSLAERLGNDLVLGHTLGLLCTAEFRAADQGGEPTLVEESIVHGERSVEILTRLPAGDSLVMAHGYPGGGVQLSKSSGQSRRTLRGRDGSIERTGIGLADELASRATSPSCSPAREYAGDFGARWEAEGSQRDDLSRGAGDLLPPLAGLVYSCSRGRGGSAGSTLCGLTSDRPSILRVFKHTKTGPLSKVSYTVRMSA